MAFNNYIFNTKPRFAQSLPDEISVVCGDKLALEVTYYHAKTCEWQVASITGNKITPLPEYVEALNAATSLSPYGYGSSKTNAYVGEGFDALWICPRISNGVVDVEAEAKQINITKRTISRLKMYKFQLPRHGEEPNYTITFDETNEECVDKDSTLVGYYEGSFTNEVKKPLEGGKEYYVVISLKLKKDYAEFTTDENGDGTAYFGWTYSGQCEGAEKLTGYCSMDANSLFYVYKYTVPIPNDGAGVQLEKVSTGINTPVIGESMKKREYTYLQDLRALRISPGPQLR